MKIVRRKIVKTKKNKKYLQFLVFIPKEFAENTNEVVLILVSDVLIMAKDEEKAKNIIRGLVKLNAL